MSARVRLDYAAFRAFRQSPEVQAAIEAEARVMAQRADSMSMRNDAGTPDYEATTAMSESKGSVALVSTGNTAARVDNAFHNTLLKAVTGGGG